MVGYCECSNETSGYIECGKFVKDLLVSQYGLCTMEPRNCLLHYTYIS